MKNFLNILDNKKIFKLVLGLGNQSVDEIKECVSIYAKAGCDVFDINASQEAINALYEGLKSAGLDDTLICISIGAQGDIHTQKAFIDNSKCVKCNSCIKHCPQDAIIYKDGFPFVLSEKCIGCGKCKCKAITYNGEQSDFDEAIRLAEKYGAATVELHVSTKKPPMKEIKQLLSRLNCPLCLCLDRKYYSNEKIKKLLNKVIEYNGSNKFIIQADGLPMSGGEDDYNSTLQAVAMAHYVQDFGIYILISGGTNSKTAALAKQCGVRYNGISVGSYARKIIKGKPYDEALKVAKELVESCKI